VAPPPLEESFEHRAELLARRRQEILGAWRMLLVEATLDDACVLELLQPCRQRVWADAGQTVLEILKLARAEAVEVANDEDGPALADELERSGDRAAIGQRSGAVKAGWSVIGRT
jgi:hypothetical protein